MNAGDEEILFTVTRQKTRLLVHRVPEGLLAKTADGEDNPLSWVFIHISSGVNWWMHNVILDQKGPSPEYEYDKETILNALDNSHERLISFFTANDGQAMGQTFSYIDSDGSKTELTGRDRVLYLTDHEIHHRAKAVLALRPWGFTDCPFMPF